MECERLEVVGRHGDLWERMNGKKSGLILVILG
jgi:hypothetical protein